MSTREYANTLVLWRLYKALYLHAYQYSVDVGNKTCADFDFLVKFPPLKNINKMLFCLPAVTLAMQRDGSSGGLVRLAVITKDGVERLTILQDDLPKFSNV